MAETSEFELIRRHLSGLGAVRDDVELGVGDDAAIIQSGGCARQLMALDTLVDGVHFPSDFPAEWVGYRALAVNLSDIAAMGGEPRWALLGLTLPSADEPWVADFARGLDQLAKANRVALVGGDVTRGPLAVSLQISGVINAEPLRRDGAAPGDQVWVSGEPGQAAAGLAVWQSEGSRDDTRWQALLRAFSHPLPRLALGKALVGVATAAIDVSDGVIADAGHIAARSGVKLQLDPHACQLSAPLLQWAGNAEAAERLWRGGGDDYELCFTAPASATAAVVSAAERAATPVQCIGQVEHGAGVYWGDQCCTEKSTAGFQHFGAG